MATVRITCTAGAWTQVTNASKAGTIVLSSGDVTLTESATQPTGDAGDTPKSGVLTQSGAWGSYAGVGASEFIWAFCPKESFIDVTPADGGAL